MSFTLTERAKQDLENLTDFSMMRFGHSQTRAYLRHLESALTQLSEMPTLGRFRPELAHGLRSYPCSRHTIYYLEQDNGVVIIRILHQSMEPSGRF